MRIKRATSGALLRSCVLVVRGLYQDMDVIDRASAVFETIMADESRTRVQADHFSRAGTMAGSGMRYKAGGA